MRPLFGVALLVWIGLTIGGFLFEWLTGNSRWMQAAKASYEHAFAMAALALALWYWEIK